MSNEDFEFTRADVGCGCVFMIAVLAFVLYCGSPVQCGKSSKTPSSGTSPTSSKTTGATPR